MYKLLTIALCFLIIILLLRRIKKRSPQIEIEPAEEYSRQGFTLPWISQAASTVKAIIIIDYGHKSKWYEKAGIVCSIVVAFCTFVSLVLDHLDALSSFFGHMFA